MTYNKLINPLIDQAFSMGYTVDLTHNIQVLDGNPLSSNVRNIEGEYREVCEL